VPPPESSKFQLDLDIPTEQLLVPGFVVQQNMYAYTEKEFKLALKVFANYDSLAKAHVILINELILADREIAFLYEGWTECINTLAKVNADREFIYKLRKDDLIARDKEIRKQKIKTVLFTAGGGVLGVGVGIIIGIFAIK
jgi:hypothetical protein